MIKTIIYQVQVEGEIGQLYKVRVGFHGNKYDVPWYSNYSMAPSWFLENVSFNMKLKFPKIGCSKLFKPCNI